MIEGPHFAFCGDKGFPRSGLYDNLYVGPVSRRAKGALPEEVKHLYIVIRQH